MARQRKRCVAPFPTFCGETKGFPDSPGAALKVFATWLKREAR